MTYECKKCGRITYASVQKGICKQCMKLYENKTIKNKEKHS